MIAPLHTHKHISSHCVIVVTPHSLIYQISCITRRKFSLCELQIHTQGQAAEAVPTVAMAGHSLGPGHGHRWGPDYGAALGVAPGCCPTASPSKAQVCEHSKMNLPGVCRAWVSGGRKKLQHVELK